MKIKYKPIIRKEGIEELVSAELIDNELCVTVLKSWPTFAEAKAHETSEKEYDPVNVMEESYRLGYRYIAETTISEEEAKDFIKQKEADAEKAATEAEKQEALDYLRETDYVVIKIAEGAATKEEYLGVIKRRGMARNTLS